MRLAQNVIERDPRRYTACAHGILSMRGLAKSRSTQARTMARVNRTQYARRADLRMTSLLAKLQAWQAHVAAQLARAVPVGSNSTQNLIGGGCVRHDIKTPTWCPSILHSMESSTTFCSASGLLGCRGKPSNGSQAY